MINLRFELIKFHYVHIKYIMYVHTNVCALSHYNIGILYTYYVGPNYVNGIYDTRSLSLVDFMTSITRHKSLSLKMEIFAIA